MNYARRIAHGCFNDPCVECAATYSSSLTFEIITPSSSRLTTPHAMRTPNKPPPKGQKTISSFFAAGATAKKRPASSSATVSSSLVDANEAVVILGDDDDVDGGAGDARAGKKAKTIEKDDVVHAEAVAVAEAPATAVDVRAVLHSIPASKPETHAKFLHKLSLDRRRRDLEGDGDGAKSLASSPCACSTTSR